MDQNIITAKILLSSDQTKNKPKRIIVNGQYTKKFLKWNRKQIKKGKLDFYLGEDQYYDLNEKKYFDISNIQDRRYKTFKLKKLFIGKYNLLSNTFNNNIQVSIPKFRPVFDKILTLNVSKLVYDKSISLNNNYLLQAIKNKYKLKGEYLILITKVDSQKTMINDGINSLINFNMRKSDIIQKFRSNSEFMIWNDKDLHSNNEKIRITIVKDKKLSTEIIRQKYLDGANHCVLYPIKEYFIECKNKTKSKKSSDNYQKAIYKIEKFIEKFKYGVKNEQFPEICDELKIGVMINSPFQKIPFYEYRCDGKPYKIFKFLNTRLNHVERNKDMYKEDALFSNGKRINKTRIELKQIIENCKKNNELCIYSKDWYSISRVQTLNNNYQLNDDYYDAVCDFEKKYKLNYCTIDAKKYPELQAFIDNGTHFNGTRDFKNVEQYRNGVPDHIQHIDMKAAYTQFKNCKYYSGFMGKITDFRMIDNQDIYKTVNGLYYIENLDLSKCNEKFKKLNEKLLWFYSKNIYTDAELRALKDLKGDFKIIAGAYGQKLDFEFNKKMTDSKVEVNIGDKQINLPYYSKWSGGNCSLSESKNYYVDCDESYAKTLIDKDHDVYYHDGVARVRVEKEKMYNKKHITSQITAYQRLIVLNQLLKMDVDLIWRVCVDGIYYDDHQFNIEFPFRPKNGKNDKTFRNYECEQYLSELNTCKNDIILPTAKSRPHYNKELFIGAGGNGKTYYNCKDEGLINAIYAGHSCKLGVSVNKEHNMIYTTHNTLLRGHDKDFILDYYNNFIIDECSMISKETKKYLFKKCNGKIIFMGDLECQIIDSDVMNKNNFDKVTEFKKNYRFKCEKLIEIIDKTRLYIKKRKEFNFLDLGLQTIKMNDLKGEYKKEDIILRHLNELKGKKKEINFTKIFNNIDKYKITKNNKDFKNGEIVYEEVMNSEMRHGFTTHCVQGETFNNMIYIHINEIRDERIFYTAISRAKYYKQIKLII